MPKWKNKLKEVGKKVEQNVNKGAEKLGKEAGRVGNQVAAEAERVGKRVERETKRIGEQVAQEAERVEARVDREYERGVDKIADKVAERVVEKVAEQAAERERLEAEAKAAAEPQGDVGARAEALSADLACFEAEQQRFQVAQQDKVQAALTPINREAAQILETIAADCKTIGEKVEQAQKLLAQVESEINHARASENISEEAVIQMELDSTTSLTVARGAVKMVQLLQKQSEGSRKKTEEERGRIANLLNEAKGEAEKVTLEGAKIISVLTSTQAKIKSNITKIDEALETLRQKQSEIGQIISQIKPAAAVKQPEGERSQPADSGPIVVELGARLAAAQAALASRSQPALSDAPAPLSSSSHQPLAPLQQAQAHVQAGRAVASEEEGAKLNKNNVGVSLG